ncbi:MAG: polyphosphate kinase 1 [Anaerostipes sp.]|nr:polyphosphate kinase 1 [Anaerostipes sp.]
MKDEIKGREMYMNRELSWVKFNERVLEEAEKQTTPLCERLSFASIFQSNLDEFFMVRVASLHDQMLVHKHIKKDNKTKMTAKEQIDAVLHEVKKLNRRKDVAYQDMMDQLEEKGVRMVDFQKITKEESEFLAGYFEEEIAPLISPTIVGKKQPFPFLRNKEIYAVVILETKGGKEKIGIIPCTNLVVDRLIQLPTREGAYMLSEDIILHYVPQVFSKYHVKAKSVIRVTRNADIDADALYDEDLDYREFMEDLIKKRKKRMPIRLELSREMDSSIVESLCRFLEVNRDYVFKNNTPLDLSFLFQLQDVLRNKEELFYEKRVPQKSPMFQEGKSIIAQIKEKDKMLSFPYENIRPFITLLGEAAEDPKVVSIKMTLYRVAKHSKIVEALVDAAENGKEVTVLVELKARFDEENNIKWSRHLEKAGCRVIYGIDNYKVHSKLCLITRKEEGKVEYITQVGTGNYNEKTSKIYTDLSIMTANPEIGMEANEVFKALALETVVDETSHLLVAPKCLQNKVLKMMDGEIAHAQAGEEAYIGLKLNSLTDKAIIDKLIEASQAGVKIDMIIRGICCLVPGIPGITENIRVISIVGRFLEHSRIYIFGCNGREKIYIASADYMTRNTLRRVEVAIPVYDEEIKNALSEMFITMLSDNTQARELGADGVYRNVKDGDSKLNAQEFFYEQAYSARGNE